MSEPIKAQTREFEVNGMKVTVGEPPFDLEMDFELMLGDDASNEAWLRKQYPLLWVREIDDEPAWPMKRSEYNAMRKRLDREGYTRVAKAVGEILEGQDEQSKNSPGTPNSDSDVA